MTKVKTVEKQVGTIVIDGREYVRKEVKQVCRKCGSDRVEKPAFHCNDETGDITKRWVCWNCETNFDNVEGLRVSEGVLQ